MSALMETRDVAGVFDSEEAAAAAVDKLLAEHFGACNDLSVIVSKHHERQSVVIWEPPPVYSAAAVGAGVGAVLAALIVGFAGIRFGPFTLVEWGPLWAVFEAAFTGGSVGFALGAMTSFEMVYPRADFGTVGIHDGVVWVGLHASPARAERAEAILAEGGARHVLERPETFEHFSFRHAA
jgi:hypothetical protein